MKPEQVQQLFESSSAAPDGELVRDAALAGLGLAHLPTFIVGPSLQQKHLISVLDAFRPPFVGIHAVYPSHRQSSLLVTAFNEFLRQHLNVEHENSSEA